MQGDAPPAVSRQLQSEVRGSPADAKLRIFLAQLLMVTGDWDRAVNQLQVAGGARCRGASHDARLLGRHPVRAVAGRGLRG